MAADDDEAVIDLDVTDEIRAVVSDQFRRQLPPNYEFDEASFIEFIMLLVANRRSKAQIRREMAPFVGDDAATLVDWLFSTLNAMRPPSAPKGRLASVVLAPPSAAAPVALDAAPGPPTHRRAPSNSNIASRLLANAAKDAVKSTTERRLAPGADVRDRSPTSIATRRERFALQASRPAELHTRRVLDAAQKRSRSPRHAVMDVEVKRVKSHVPQNLDLLLDRKLPSRSELQTTSKATARRRSPSPPSDAERFRADSEEDEARPLRRRPTIAASKLDQILSRTLSGSSRRASSDDQAPRRVDRNTFTVSITNDTHKKGAGVAAPAVSAEKPEPKVVFKVPGAVTPAAGPKPGVVATVDSALPRKLTRCAFWPNCEKGDACAFLHPTQPCKYWPSCQFGDKCLYIHDKNLVNVTIPCKFGAQCTRGPSCKFSHTAPAPAAADTEGPARVCRFDKRCTKITCTFKHPERDRTEYFNERLRESGDDNDDDVTVVLSSTLPLTPPSHSF